jgi:hypothetical protein
LKAPNLPTIAFCCIVACLPSGCKIDPKNSGSFILRDLSRYPKRFSRESAVSLSKFFRLSQNFKNSIVRGSDLALIQVSQDMRGNSILGLFGKLLDLHNSFLQ